MMSHCLLNKNMGLNVCKPSFPLEKSIFFPLIFFLLFFCESLKKQQQTEGVTQQNIFTLQVEADGTP